MLQSLAVLHTYCYVILLYWIIEILEALIILDLTEIRGTIQLFVLSEKRQKRFFKLFMKSI